MPVDIPGGPFPELLYNCALCILFYMFWKHAAIVAIAFSISISRSPSQLSWSKRFRLLLDMGRLGRVRVAGACLTTAVNRQDMLVRDLLDLLDLFSDHKPPVVLSPCPLQHRHLPSSVFLFIDCTPQYHACRIPRRSTPRSYQLYTTLIPFRLL